MAELTPKEQLALHEFSVRYRATFAKEHPTPEHSLDTVRDAVRGEWEREQDVKREHTVEPPTKAKEDREPEAPGD